MTEATTEEPGSRTFRLRGRAFVSLFRSREHGIKRRNVGSFPEKPNTRQRTVPMSNVRSIPDTVLFDFQPRSREYFLMIESVQRFVRRIPRRGIREIFYNSRPPRLRLSVGNARLMRKTFSISIMAVVVGGRCKAIRRKPFGSCVSIKRRFSVGQHGTATRHRDATPRSSENDATPLR